MPAVHHSQHAAVRMLSQQVRPVALAYEQTLPVLPPFAELFPEGLQRGTTVGVARAPGAPSMLTSGATALALALAAAPSQAGSWVAAVGLPSLGLVAAHELGVVLERLVVIDPVPSDRWVTTVAALVGAFDLVLVGVPRSLRSADARRLVARMRERGTVLVQLDERGYPTPQALGGWGGTPPSARGAFQLDVRLTVVAAEWHGLGASHGYLRSRRVEIEVIGRGRAARARHAQLWLPGPDGTIAVAGNAASDAGAVGAAGGAVDVASVSRSTRGVRLLSPRSSGWREVS
ncbi:MAG: hypothetical protein N2037_06555 [Acidimicrobiales bacterium]|nr:hypothetical protein [Acidimicrobiales bacterium]